MLIIYKRSICQYVLPTCLCQELETPEAVDLETTGRVTVPDEITQPDKNNDETTVSTPRGPSYLLKTGSLYNAFQGFDWFNGLSI